MTVLPATAWRWLAASLAMAFGAATLLEGGHVLFGGTAARAATGEVVPFVLWFNVVAGLGYVAAGAAVFANRPWAVTIAWVLTATTTLVLLGLFVHIALGGGYMRRTVAAMIVRTMFWLAFAILVPRLVSHQRAARVNRKATAST